MSYFSILNCSHLSEFCSLYSLSRVWELSDPFKWAWSSLLGEKYISENNKIHVTHHNICLRKMLLTIFGIFLQKLTRPWFSESTSIFQRMRMYVSTINKEFWEQILPKTVFVDILLLTKAWNCNLRSSITYFWKSFIFKHKDFFLSFMTN